MKKHIFPTKIQINAEHPLEWREYQQCWIAVHNSKPFATIKKVIVGGWYVRFQDGRTFPPNESAKQMKCSVSYGKHFKRIDQAKKFVREQFDESSKG